VLKKYPCSFIFLAWMILVTFLSLYSFNDSVSIKIPHLDKIVHFTFYLVACILGVFFIQERFRNKISLLKAIFLMMIFTTVFGFIIEAIQNICTLTRQGDLYDAFANSVGSIMGAIISFKLFKGQGRFQW